MLKHCLKLAMLVEKQVMFSILEYLVLGAGKTEEAVDCLIGSTNVQVFCVLRSTSPCLELSSLEMITDWVKLQSVHHSLQMAQCTVSGCWS